MKDPSGEEYQDKSLDQSVGVALSACNMKEERGIYDTNCYRAYSSEVCTHRKEV